jgi:hypothetical protein
MSADNTPQRRPSPSSAQPDDSDGAHDDTGPGEEAPGLGVVGEADEGAAPEPNEPA